MAGEPIREIRLDVEPGLYALRYVSSSDVRSAPLASVRPVAGSIGAIEIVSVPGAASGELTGPGSSVVIVASASGTLEISLTAYRGSRNLDARFSLDLLGATQPQRLASSASQSAKTLDERGVRQSNTAEASLDIIAHVARRGDIRADENGWIAGPRAPSSIEAIQVQVRGCDVGLAAQFRNPETRASWSAWLTPGAVIGVPKKACPLTGVRFKLVGPDADRYELIGEGLFLGAPKVSARGSEIEFVAPGELDPMVGLKLSIAARSTASSTSTQEKPSRVRVFR